MALDDASALGQIVRVGDHRVHYVRVGNGSTPIIYVSGLGVWTPHHGRLLKKLSAVSETLLLDRPGYGWSDLSTFPRTIEANARDMKFALEAIGVQPPFILAGHSYGGMVALTFAALFPEHATGVLLVDSAHPDQWHRLPAAIGQTVQSRPAELWRRAALAAVDQFDPSLEEHAYSLEDRAAEKAVMAALSEPAIHVAMASELENSPHPPSEFRDLIAEPLTVPLTVLTARYSFEHFIPDRTNSLYKESQEVWLTLQHDYLAMARRSRQVFADADHALHVSDPDSIVGALKDFL